ncbi:MAG: hypothetical protein LBL34_01035 [Clostridiales bacterium]|jgi:hypothetical protein|nr:hypothetical protein [Clostridiales bacterium]
MQEERMIPLKALQAERRKLKAKLSNPRLKKGVEIMEKLEELFGVDGEEIAETLEQAELLQAELAGAEMEPQQTEASVDLQEGAGEKQVEPPSDEVPLKGGKPRSDFLADFIEMTKNPLYADCAEHIDEVCDYASENNTSLKTAYNALFAEAKYDEIRQEAERKTLEEVERRQSRRIPAVVGATEATVRKAVKLNKDQLACAEAYGMTPEEYAVYM